MPELIETLSKPAAVLFTALTLMAGLFQLAVAAGAPWGEYTLGGRYKGTLPPGARIVALFSAFVLAALVGIALNRAGFITVMSEAHAKTLAWVVVGYCVLGIIANAATPSRKERRIWLPIVITMMFASILIALS